MPTLKVKLEDNFLQEGYLANELVCMKIGKKSAYCNSPNKILWKGVTLRCQDARQTDPVFGILAEVRNPRFRWHNL